MKKCDNIDLNEAANREREITKLKAQLDKWSAERRRLCERLKKLSASKLDNEGLAARRDLTECENDYSEALYEEAKVYLQIRRLEEWDTPLVEFVYQHIYGENTNDRALDDLYPEEFEVAAQRFLDENAIPQKK